MTTQPMLIAVAPTSVSARVRLTAFKRLHGILTYRTPNMLREDSPWIAVLPLEEDKGKSIGLIMAESCRLYDEANRAVTATGELSAVRALAELNNIPCPL